MVNNKRPKKGVLLAAGGLLWREADGARELALVYRPKYKDWTLPKGRLKKKETFQDAAVREVYEETGCQGRLVSLAGSTCYIAFDLPKIVVFWNMALIKQEKFEPNDEVGEVIWQSPGDAIKRLSYEAEIALIEKNIDLGGSNGCS